MIEIFSPIFDDVYQIVISIPSITGLSGFTGNLYNILGSPIITAAIIHSDNTASGIAIVNPTYIFAGILTCIGVYSVFKIIGVFFNSL